MIINPREIVEREILYPVERDQIQPNSIDLRIDRVHVVSGVLCLEKNDRKLPRYESYPPSVENGKEIFKFEPSQTYIVTCIEKVRLPEDVAAICVLRSTLYRGGLSAEVGLYDSGYFGETGLTIHTNRIPARIDRGSCICQMIFFQANSAYLYRGYYLT